LKVQIRRLLLIWFPIVVMAGLCAWFWLPRGITYWQVSRLSNPVRAACEAGKDKLVLAEVADFDWDQVVILGPFVSRPWAAAALGYPWPDYLDYPQLWADNKYAGLLFLKDSRIVRTQLHWREYGEFSYPMRRIARERAVFHIQRTGTDCAFVPLTL